MNRFFWMIGFIPVFMIGGCSTSQLVRNSKRFPIRLGAIQVKNDTQRHIDTLTVISGDFDWEFRYIAPGEDKTFAQIPRLEPRLGPNATFKCRFKDENDFHLLEMKDISFVGIENAKGIVFCIQEDHSVISKPY